jgi:hypothetical protein
MKDLIELLLDLVNSYTDLNDETGLTKQSNAMIKVIKENVPVYMASMPDNIAFGIYPNVMVTDEGENFLYNHDILNEKLPAWQEIRNMKLFQINGESELIRSLPMIDENVAVKILFAVAYVRQKIQEEKNE